MNVNYFKYDFCYNLMCFESWLKLVKILDEVKLLKKLILNEIFVVDFCIWFMVVFIIYLFFWFLLL